MKSHLQRTFMLAFAVIVGCVPSLHPVYTEKDIIFEKALINVWKQEGKTSTWNFSKNKGKTYRLVITDENGKSGAFAAHLVKIDNTMLLDIFPEEIEINTTAFYKMHLLPCHTFVVIDSIEPTLNIRFLDINWLAGFLNDNQDALAHERVNNQTVITASTKDYQQFILKHLQTDDAFTDPVVLKKQKQDKL